GAAAVGRGGRGSPREWSGSRGSWTAVRGGVPRGSTTCARRQAGSLAALTAPHCRNLGGAGLLQSPAGTSTPPETQTPPRTTHPNPRSCGNESQLAREQDSLHTAHAIHPFSQNPTI